MTTATIVRPGGGVAQDVGSDVNLACVVADLPEGVTVTNVQFTKDGSNLGAAVTVPVGNEYQQTDASVTPAATHVYGAVATLSVGTVTAPTVTVHIEAVAKGTIDTPGGTTAEPAKATMSDGGSRRAKTVSINVSTDINTSPVTESVRVGRHASNNDLAKAIADKVMARGDVSSGNGKSGAPDQGDPSAEVVVWPQAPATTVTLATLTVVNA